MADKTRVHILANELNVKSNAIVEKCKAEGITSVKNHMSTLSAGLEATIREWFSDGAHVTAVERAERVDLKKVRKPRKKRVAPSVDSAESDDSQTATAVVDMPAESSPAETDEAASPDEEEEFVAAETSPESLAQADAGTTAVVEPELPRQDDESVAATIAPSSETVETPEEPAQADEVSSVDAAASVESPPQGAEAPMADQDESAEPEPAAPFAPAGPQNVPTPAKLKGPRVVRYEAPEYDVGPPPRGPARSQSGTSDGERGKEPVGPSTARRGAVADRGRDKTGRVRPGGRRHRGGDAGERVREWGDRDLLERRERMAGATGRRIHVRRAVDSTRQTQPVARKTDAEIEAPVTLKKFCAGTGLSFVQVFGVLQKEHGILANMNTVLDDELAQLVALDLGVELKIKPAKTQLDVLHDEFGARERKHLKPRAPVITFLGHVDHGKTTLMDAIRRARTVEGEQGGITQHIGSYHFNRGSLAVTFLDTPGHKAFTAMRARGAQMTDIVVLVVAADDGVMPQTVEAINHAKAAEVPIVVALNKCDLPGFDKTKIFGQLTEHGLTPSGDWGGQTDVIMTSATKGTGIDDLLEHLQMHADLLELNADATVAVRGTVIEAETREGVGAVARILVQEGTLKRSCFLVCGSASGKVRAIVDDRGKQIQSAGPSMPVEVWGLDSVPMAGDPVFEVDSMQRAKAIADEVRTQRTVSGRADMQKARSLEELLGKRDAESKSELNVIIKADVDGSIEAIKQMLSELPTDQVNLTVRHAAVGPVTDSDVALADTSNSIIIAFNVVPVGGAKKLAEDSGVEIRPYRVIYDVVDDITKAMEGLLAPEERREDRGTVDVREVFRITKVGLVAGCYVTHGTIARNHHARLIRDGVVIRDDCKLDSLRRFKDDVKEVREGMECGIRLEGFDDVKQGDVIETYDVVSVARKL